MCGISFLYHPGLAEKERGQQMDSSLSDLAHRGPDDHGIWHGKATVIGHRRLSIIDLAASHQPMVCPDGRFVLSYNGEIYNYQQLQKQLSGKWDFRTNGDTEVLLAGLMREGTDFLGKLEGMWAFVLWDSQKQEALLCRDRMGKKPLYFETGQDYLACSSELPALAQLSKNAWQEDLDSTADFLRYGYYLPGTTAWEGVKEVMPGHLLRWSPSLGIHEHSPYWSLSLSRWQGSKAEAGQELRDVFVQAVKKRLVADVEVGAFLSGGVDSSLVVAVLCRELGITPKTFTIGFQERTYDERRFARQIAEEWGTDHYEEVLTDWDASTLTGLILNNIGQPFADSSLLPTAMVSQLAASQVKVALSGDGGDELFSGYQRYMARSIMRWYTRLPACLRKGADRAIRVLPEPMAHHSGSILKKAHLFLDIAARSGDESPYVASLLYCHRDFEQLCPQLINRGHQPPQMPDECNLDDIQRMMTADALVYLPQDILLKVDRASMACSLETRAPFLDHRVVELAFSLPRNWHRRGLKGKRMLQESFGDILPDNIWQRRKQGFAVPIHQWFRGDLGQELEELLGTVSSPFRTETVLNMLKQHRGRQRDQGYRLWSIYIYLLWKSRCTIQS